VSISHKPEVKSLPNFQCMLPMAMASDGIAACSVLSVLWMISCFLYGAGELQVGSSSQNDSGQRGSTDLTHTTVYTQIYSPGDSTGPGVASDVYRCLVVRMSISQVCKQVWTMQFVSLCFRDDDFDDEQTPRCRSKKDVCFDDIDDVGTPNSTPVTVGSIPDS